MLRRTCLRHAKDAQNKTHQYLNVLSLWGNYHIAFGLAPPVRRACDNRVLRRGVVRVDHGTVIIAHGVRERVGPGVRERVRPGVRSGGGMMRGRVVGGGCVARIDAIRERVGPGVRSGGGVMRGVVGGGCAARIDAIRARAGAGV